MVTKFNLFLEIYDSFEILIKKASYNYGPGCLKDDTEVTNIYKRSNLCIPWGNFTKKISMINEKESRLMLIQSHNFLEKYRTRSLNKFKYDMIFKMMMD